MSEPSIPDGEADLTSQMAEPSFNTTMSEPTRDLTPSASADVVPPAAERENKVLSRHAKRGDGSVPSSSVQPEAVLR